MCVFTQLPGFQLGLALAYTNASHWAETEVLSGVPTEFTPPNRATGHKGTVFMFLSFQLGRGDLLCVCCVSHNPQVGAAIHNNGCAGGKQHRFFLISAGCVCRTP